MYKKLLPAAVALLSAASAGATDYNPYVALKGSYSTVRNNAVSTMDFINPNEGAVKNTIINERIHDEVWGVKIAAGLKFNGNFRAELEYGYNDKTSNSGQSSFKFGSKAESYDLSFDHSMKIQTLFANFYYDFDTGTAITPYAGFGLGYARLESKAGAAVPSLQYTTDAKDKDERFAYNLSAGVAYAVNNNIAVDLGYRFTDYGKMKDRSSADSLVGYSKYHVQSHEVLLGLRYTF